MSNKISFLDQAEAIPIKPYEPKYKKGDVLEVKDTLGNIKFIVQVLYRHKNAYVVQYMWTVEQLKSLLGFKEATNVYRTDNDNLISKNNKLKVLYGL